KNQDVSQIEAGFANERKQAQDAINAANVQIQELNRQLTGANTQIQTLQTKLGENRINTQDPITRHPDGKIMRIPAKDTVNTNIKYNFVVYGDFDMDRNGVATPGEADIVKRLITQWGGKLMDLVNVDTDFVVLGKEPVLPTFTKEELQDPFNAKKLADAQAALDAYQ